MSTVRNVVLFAVMVLLVWFILHDGLKRAEIAECVSWVEQAEENPFFYLADWQIEQCNALEFDIHLGGE